MPRTVPTVSRWASKVVAVVACSVFRFLDIGSASLRLLKNIEEACAFIRLWHHTSNILQPSEQEFAFVLAVVSWLFSSMSMAAWQVPLAD